MSAEAGARAGRPAERAAPTGDGAAVICPRQAPPADPPGHAAAPAAEAACPEAAAAAALSEREQAVLEFERRFWRHPGAKEQAIRETFGLTPTHYYQILRGLLARPAALAHDPVLVGRLNRLRQRRARRDPS